MIDVEFSMDVYSKAQKSDGIVMSSKGDTLCSAIEIVLQKKPPERLSGVWVKIFCLRI